jgi:hypothetical protein
MTFLAEIISGFEIWFEVVIFKIQILNCSNFFTGKDDQNQHNK